VNANYIIQSTKDALYIWKQEMKQIFRDEGVLIFFIIVPLIYPLLYSWIYNNEVVREVPVAVVDQSHSGISRQFIRLCDASPDVRIAYYADDLDEAKMLVSRQVVKGVYLIPSDFDLNVQRLQQATISVYCDMSLMLTYKAIYQTAQAVSSDMGSRIQTRLSGYYTSREEEIGSRPLDFDEVPIFNPSGGYGSFVLPAVLMLILQQTLVLGIGLAAGTARERNRYGDLIPNNHHYQGMFRIINGKFMAYFMVFAVMGAYLTMAVPRLFSFPQLATWDVLLGIMLPYLLACIFFGMTVSCLVRYRENVMLLVVFLSVPLLFLSGVSWPQSAIPGAWQGVSWLFPSTFGIRAYVRANSMGATLSDIMLEYRCLWIQAGFYFCLCCLVYRHQILQARRHARERAAQMERKHEVRRKLAARKA
jgi:ABC-2 type transport system permease protein